MATLSLLTLAAAPQLSDSAAPHTFGVSGFGWFVSGTTCAGPAREQLQQQVALAHAAGVRLLRFDLVWNATEPRPGSAIWHPRSPPPAGGSAMPGRPRMSNIC